MDFNSNDEYLKAYPPNFGPKIERPSKEKLCDLKAYGLPPKDPQVLVTMASFLISFHKGFAVSGQIYDGERPNCC
jgi:hypothetical protein